MHIKKELKEKIEKSRDRLTESDSEFGGVFVDRVYQEYGVSFTVETSPGDVAFSIDLKDEDLDGGDTVEDVYLEILEGLNSEGYSVYKDRSSWEDSAF
jgi:hypothetical protein